MDSWECRRLAVVLPREIVETMWRRAHQWDVAAGGRFEAHGGTILLWSHNLTSASARPIAAVSLGWGEPDARSATVEHVAWDPQSSSESEICRAVALLAGVHQLTPPR